MINFTEKHPDNKILKITIMPEKIEETSETVKDNWGKKQQKDYRVEIVLMLILGILMGVAVKTEASKRITIGSDDYKMKFFANTYNWSNLEKELAKIREEAQRVEAENSQLTAPAGEELPSAE